MSSHIMTVKPLDGYLEEQYWMNRGPSVGKSDHLETASQETRGLTT